MKVSELTGTQLEQWAEKAFGHALDINKPIMNDALLFRIFQKEKIEPRWDHTQERWQASQLSKQGAAEVFYGESLKIAGMRAFVASKFGNTVPDE